jgi:hypothetical protein
MRDQQRALHTAYAVAQALSPVVVGVGLAGPSGWVLLPGIPAMVLSLSGRRQMGLGLGVLLEAVVLWRHGITAALLLSGLWLSWQPGRGAHISAVVAFAVAALIGSHARIGGIAAGVCTLVLVLEQLRVC